MDCIDQSASCRRVLRAVILAIGLLSLAAPVFAQAKDAEVSKVTRSTAGSCSGSRCFYVAVCPNNGNGASLSCAATPGGVGAFNTVQAGLDAATRAGDWVLIGDGTYDCTSDGSGDSDVDGGCAVQGSGTSASAIVITYATTARGPILRNANTATPTAYSQANNPTLNLTGHDYVTIRGLTIQGSIRVFNEDPTSLARLRLGLLIEGNEITRGWADPGDGNWSGIWLEGCRFSSVRGNYIHDITNKLTGAGLQASLSGIKLYTCIDSTYEYNTVLNAIEVSGGSHAGGIDDKQDSIRNVHRYNDFKGVQNCLRFQNQQRLGNATGTQAYGNLCRLGSASGIRYVMEFEDGGFSDLTIYNNTFVGGWNWGMHFATPVTPVRGLRVYNNAFRGMTGLNIDTDSGLNANTNAWTLLDYNFYGKRDFRLRSSTHGSRSAMSRAEGVERNGCEVGKDSACKSWGFTNEAGDDYTLLANSPLKSAGRTGGTSDGMPVDIGAFGVTSCVGHRCSGSGW
jgi:hypothetical protein